MNLQKDNNDKGIKQLQNGRKIDKQTKWLKTNIEKMWIQNNNTTPKICWTCLKLWPNCTAGVTWKCEVRLVLSKVWSEVSFTEKELPKKNKTGLGKMTKPGITSKLVFITVTEI